MRVVLLTAAVVCFAVAATVAVRGRVDFLVAQYRIPVRGTSLPGAIGWVFLIGGASQVTRARREQLIADTTGWIRRHSRAIAAAVAVATLLLGIAKGAFVAAGADSYGYVSQSGLWTAGNPIQIEPLLAIDAPWPNADWTFAPLGYRPGLVRGTIVPTYPIGLPLQMAALSRVFGDQALFLVVPFLGALAVWLSFAIARRIASPEIAALVAILAACNPVFLVQLVQPMSDVPVTAWWLAALALAFGSSLRSALAAGAAASLAILTRPNTVPLMLPLLLPLVLGPEPVTKRLARAGAALVGAVPGIAVVAWSDIVFYGSPFRSGYGPVGEIYSGARAADMTMGYLRALWSTYTPLIYAAFIVPVLTFATNAQVSAELRRFCWTACLFAVTLLALYVTYSVFDIRFLLPAVAVLLIASTAAIDVLTLSWSQTARAAAFAVALTLLPLAFVHRATQDGAWRLKGEFATRFAESGHRARSLPKNAVLLSIVESGSLRYYGGHLTMRFDWLPEESLDQALAYLTSHGHDVYLAGTPAEVHEFREKFARSPIVRSVKSDTSVLERESDVAWFVLARSPSER